MKGFKNCLAVAVVVMAAALTLAGCASTDFKSPSMGSINIATIATKDYEVLGLVSVESEDVKTVSPLGIIHKHVGSKVTYDLLLQEAKKQFPDASDIVNVRIDKYDNSKWHVFAFFTGTKKTIKYVGNALAIRYTTGITSETPRNPPSGSLPGSDGGKEGLFGLGILGL